MGAQYEEIQTSDTWKGAGFNKNRFLNNFSKTQIKPLAEVYFNNPIYNILKGIPINLRAN